MQTEHARTDPVRAFLEKLLADHGTGPVPVSKAIGRNRAYLSHYLRGRSPAILPDEVRAALGRHFRVDPDAFKPPPDFSADPAAPGDLDPLLLDRANRVARYVIGEDPADELIRVNIAAAAYPLLKSGGLNDDVGTLAVLELLARRLRALKPPET